MKHTKKALKHTFGDHKSGFSYLASVKAGSKSPVLFLYGSGAYGFAGWLSKFAAASEETSASQMPSSAKQGSFLIVKEDTDLSNELIQKCVGLMKSKVAVAVVSDKRPTILDYIYDPAFKVLEIPDFDVEGPFKELQEALAEI